MTLKTYKGSCHCGAVRFEADLDLSAGTIRCNCSSCTKARSWLAITSPDHFRLTSGVEAQATYQWTPPGQGKPRNHYHFCKACGIRTPARGEAAELGGLFFAVQINLLDDVDVDDLASSPIRYVDGRHDHFDRPPKETRLL